MEDDRIMTLTDVHSWQFQSTSPVWRTTILTGKCILDKCHFNPRPPCGGRPRFFFCPFFYFCISIHVPRVEDDVVAYLFLLSTDYFNPRPPCGGRRIQYTYILRAVDFNPRPPCGGRLLPFPVPLSDLRFQSTSPVWRTTAILH